MARMTSVKLAAEPPVEAGVESVHTEAAEVAAVLAPARPVAKGAWHSLSQGWW